MFATEQKIQATNINPEKITVLVVSPHHEDHSVVRRLLQHGDWKVVRTANLREAIPALEDTSPAVVICERDLPDGTWRELMRKVSELKNAPSVIVTSRHADESLWGDVLNAGGYDVLPKPFDRSEMMRVLSMAWRHACAFRKRPVMAVTATSF